MTINGYVSEPFLASSGVGQGSHLGPILFLLFINDLRSVIKRSNFLLFADDCKIFKCIKSRNDSVDLQQDTNAFVDWCVLNGLDLNISKCKHIRFTRLIEPTYVSYYIDDNVIESVSSIKDLGVFFDSKMSFNVHIDSVVSRANKLLGFVNRMTKSFSSIRCVLVLYTSLVRSILEYCSIIWAPSYQVHVDRLESVQRKFIKLGVNFYQFNYDYFLKYFSLPSLVQRRSYAMFLFKIFNNTIRCSSLHDHFPLFIPSRTVRFPLILSVDFHRTNYGLHSSISRISRLANSLHLTDGSFACDVLTFRSLLRQLLYK